MMDVMDAPIGSAAASADFEDVFAREHVALVRFATLLCGDPDRAEDVVADVFARMLRRWKRQRPDDPSAYLRRAVVNETKNLFRSRDRARRATARLPRTDAAVAPIEGRDDVWRAVLALPDQQRAVVLLRFAEDRSEAETAAILDLPIGTVKSTTSRALARLRELLPENDDA
jgi:RNA polymerase sigma-70 factor (sigma-E family)